MSQGDIARRELCGLGYFCGLILFFLLLLSLRLFYVMSCVFGKARLQKNVLRYRFKFAML